MLETTVMPEKPKEETEANIMACLLLPGRIAVIIKRYSNHKTLSLDFKDTSQLFQNQLPRNPVPINSSCKITCKLNS